MRLEYTGTPPPKCQHCGIFIRRINECIKTWRKRKYCCRECSVEAKNEMATANALLTAIDAAKLIGVDRDYIYQLVANGSLPYERIESRIYLREDDVQAFTVRQKKKPGRPRSEQCQRGHAMSGDNVGVSSSGGRRCLECARMRARKAGV